MGVSGQRHDPAALPPGKKSGTHCTEGWVGPRAGPVGCGKYRPYRHSIPDRPAVASLYTDCAIPARLEIPVATYNTYARHKLLLLN
jgi:hypothetical protein